MCRSGAFYANNDTRGETLSSAAPFVGCDEAIGCLSRRRELLSLRNIPCNPRVFTPSDVYDGRNDCAMTENH